MLIDLLKQFDVDTMDESSLVAQAMDDIERVKASAGRGDRKQVVRAETEVKASVEKCFKFATDGSASLITTAGSFSAGQFETPSIAQLKQRLGSSRSSIRLFVFDGGGPATDIGSLQAFASPGTLFQVASQFNCLEAPSSYIVPVADYFNDFTQGPRASISAYSGTLLRHYAAPGADGTRFTQSSSNQINLLEAVCEPGLARVECGYLKANFIDDAPKFAKILEDRFDQLRVGVHDDLPVLLGHNWDGGVTGDVRIGQVFTSTLAAGMYSRVDVHQPPYGTVARWLLRAAYLGTILAAASLKRTTVVLTLIGGGVFGNPASLIWESILWAITEAERVIPSDMTVVVNGYNLGQQVPLESLLPDIRKHHGNAVVFDRGVRVLR